MDDPRKPFDDPPEPEVDQRPPEEPPEPLEDLRPLDEPPEDTPPPKSVTLSRENTWTPPFDNVPAELRDPAMRRWVMWYRDVVKGKPDKVPYCVAYPDRKPTSGSHPRRRASTADPSTWSSYDETVVAWHLGYASGLGFVFTAPDPYCGIDLAVLC